MADLIPFSALTVFLYMTALFLLALIRKDNSLADLGWGLGFILVAGLAFVRTPEVTARRILVLSLVVLWGARLAAHILVRNRKRGEDFRYAKWRKDWGRWFVPRSYLQVFLLQGTFLLVISTPVLIVMGSRTPGVGFLDAAGLAVWITGFVFETAADAQLLRFKRDPANRGRIMKTGLWRYSRHPNYFGEATMWWGIFLIGLSEPWGWAGAIGPGWLTFLLLCVSGIPLLEKRYAGDPEFAAYAKVTSAFIPRPPRRLT
jgi:steroid 5-alpha reductase family enzyme